MHTQARLNQIVDQDTWTVDAKPLIFLDLKLGNICNLKCRICGSWSSSTYAVEELNAMNRDEDKKSSYHYLMLQKGAWPRDNPQFWEEIDQIIDQIRYIEFTGGEPFMIKEHFSLLQGIVDRGIAHRVEIHYNTNGTHWPENAEEIWRHFKTVEVAFSMDDVNQRFEYQRSNAIWAEVEQNIQHFRDLRTRNPNIQLQVCSTVNIFNVMYLETLAAWIDQQGFDFVYWNMMHEPYFFSIATLPESAKVVVKQRLDQAQVSARNRKEFDQIADFMMRGVSLDGNILRMKVQDFDVKRQQNFRDHHPEMADAISYAYGQ
jgi:MoaA/NifB/PqqE/SkfB family radical SAM enzyme